MFGFGRVLSVVDRVCTCSSTQRFVSTSTWRCAKQNLYTVLGLTPKATQSDIKKAYYKLSMQHHPDKNEGSEMAVQKFREITEAYEILGSYKSRKRYDQGMIQKFGGGGNEYTSPSEPEPEDDAQTKFYKQHMRRDRAPPPTGATPIYDFDEWSRAHYGKNFDRRQSAKKRYDRIKETQGSTKVRNIEISVLGVCAFVCFMVVYSKLDMDSYDTVSPAARSEPSPVDNSDPSQEEK